MNRTIINHLLTFLLCCIVSSGFAQNYDERCFIVQFEAGTTQAEIDALLTPLNLYVADGPTTAFINQFALICVDLEEGFPDIPVNANGEVEINGIIAGTLGNDLEQDEILDAIGLNYDISQLPHPTGAPSPFPHHPLAECGLNYFSINTIPGNNLTKVGILDSGIKVETEAGFDGFFDPFYLGWNIIQDTPDPTDDNGHGTHMASCLMSYTPSNFSSALTINAFKTHDFNGIASIWNVIEGIDKAILAGDKIISMSNSYRASFQHRYTEAPLKVAIEEALDIAGILFVSAAGNTASGGLDNDDPFGLSSYPASFPNDNILAVTAVDCNYLIPNWANYGAYSVDIAAPGVDIWGLNHESQYVKLSGTSPATALVSRLSAMLASQQSHFDYAEIKCAIINGANQSDTPNTTLSKGYLDATMAQGIFNSELPCYVASGPSASSFVAPVNNSFDASIQKGGILNIQSDQEQVANLRLFNTLGQILYAKEILIQTGQNNFELEIPDHLPFSTYVCFLQYGNESKTIKFVK